jgi:hypothetical protein
VVTVTDKCPICGKIGTIVKSNNPLVKGVCVSCLKQQIDIHNLKQAEFFCRTYNLPWLPDRWTQIVDQVDHPEDTFAVYADVISNEYKPNLYYDEGTGDLWSKLNEDYKKVLDHRELLNKIAVIKDGFNQQMQIKWGPGYTLEEYIHLEDLYTNTAKRGGITNPITLDMVKKIAIVSVAMDRSLQVGDVKTAGEYSKIHKALSDSAGLDKFIEVGTSDSINNISDLCDYLESKGFVFDWDIHEDRDVVDKTIHDQQEYVTNLVKDSLGINETFNTIKKAYEQNKETQEAAKATSDVDLDDLMEATKAGENSQFDEQLDKEDYNIDDADMPEGDDDVKP